MPVASKFISALVFGTTDFMNHVFQSSSHWEENILSHSQVIESRGWKRSQLHEIFVKRETETFQFEADLIGGLEFPNFPTKTHLCFCIDFLSEIPTSITPRFFLQQKPCQAQLPTTNVMVIHLRWLIMVPWRLVGRGGQEVEQVEAIGDLIHPWFLVLSGFCDRRTQCDYKRMVFVFSRISLVQNHEEHIQSIQALLQLVTHKTCLNLGLSLEGIAKVKETRPWFCGKW